MSSFRDKINSPAAGVIGTIAAIGALVWIVVWFLKPTEAQSLSENKIYVCMETNKQFPHKIRAGEGTPVTSPFSGRATGYPAELCFWTKDGKVAEKPTAVVTNQELGKDGPTFCPDCGRLVRPWNPRAREGEVPPPTEEEYKTSRRR